MRGFRWTGLQYGLPAVVLLAGCMAGCSTAPSAPPAATIAPDQVARVFPEAFYRDARARGKQVLQVDASHSLVEIEVRRDGPLAGLGHDHLIASHDVTGYVLPKEGVADLSIPVDKLTVDEPGLRAVAGFTTQPSASAIAGTRDNMLQHVLEAAQHPHILVHARQLDEANLELALTIRGVTRNFKVPAEIAIDKDGVAVSGSLSFKQSEFGITPYAVMNGALRVQDLLVLRFRIWAK